MKLTFKNFLNLIFSVFELDLSFDNCYWAHYDN